MVPEKAANAVPVFRRAEAMVRFMSPSDIGERHLPNASAKIRHYFFTTSVSFRLTV